MTPPARVLFPFAIITLIWGSTWIVIADQLGGVPAPWSVTYRFVFAAACMLAYALATGAPIRIGRHGHLLAAIFGLFQFCCNFNLVYQATAYVTSGLVAVSFASLVVFNALLGWIFLGLRMTGGFVIGSAVAMAGIALLFVNEVRVMPAGPGEVAAGLGYTFLAVLSASIVNVMQASERARAIPIASLLAWGMIYGVLFDGAWAWVSAGPPVIEPRLGYFAGLIYLGVVASAIAFTLYLHVIREIGPARAAYSSVIVPVIAMGLSTLFEGYRWSWFAIVGGGLVLAGLVVALRTRDRPKRPQPFGRGG